MEHCDWCNLSEEDKRFQVYESTFWSVFLSDEQDYIGRCILVLKRHCSSMAELTDDEWKELRDLICKVETCLKTVLGATLCNWSCLMNSFYKESEPNPHLHIHVRPRYDKPVMVNGSAYIDSEFSIIMQCIKADQYLPKIEKKCLFGSRKLCHHIINNCKNLFPVCINWIGTFVVVQIFAFCRKCVIHAGRTITPRGISRTPRGGVCLKDSRFYSLASL